MALMIDNPEIERLAGEVARLSGTSTEEAVREALTERFERMAAPAIRAREKHLLDFLRSEIWPPLPQSAPHHLSKQEEEAILGYGEHGEPV